MKRIDYLDIAKGLAIFLVVMGHVALVFDTPFWRLAIYAFHMPLFFLVSGTVAKCRGDFGGKGIAAFVGKNMMAIMVPYFLWAFIYLPFRFESIPWVFYGSWAALDKIGTSTALWYLPCLFCARMEFAVLDWLAGKASVSRSWLFPVLAPVAFAVGFLLPRPAIGYPWGLNTSFIALGFLILGYAIRDFLAANDRGTLGGQFAVFAVAIALFFCGTWLRRDTLSLVGMFNFQYGDLFWFFWNAFAGSAAVLALSSLLAKIPQDAVGGRFRTFLTWLGRNTIGIYLLHLPIVRFFVAPLMNDWGFPRLHPFWAFVDAVIALAICCALMLLIARYVPILFGRVAGVRKGSKAADVVQLLLGEEDYIARLDEGAIKEMLRTFQARILADGKVDLLETMLLVRVLEPLARKKGGVYVGFLDLLNRTRADGVITADESKEIAAALDNLTT